MRMSERAVVRLRWRRAAVVGLALGSPGLQDARADGSSLEVRASSEVGAYSDSDHVAVLTPSVSGHVASLTAGWSLDGSYLADVISAASVDIVSTASRRWTEVRQAGNVRASFKPHDLGATVEGSVSSEPDHLAYAGGGQIDLDVDDRNATVVLGYAFGHDVIGRTGTPFSVYSHSFDHHTIDLGLTRVLDRTTLISVAADVRIESGDSSEPYRAIPLFAPQVAASVPAGATTQWVSAMRLPVSVVERLPLSRDRFGITARIARRLSHATARIEGALYDDSWDLRAFSADGRDLVDVAPRWSLGPHVRYYVQSPVSFWKVGYVGTDETVPAYRTGDRQLGPLMNVTLGGRLQCALGPRSDVEAWTVGATFDATYTRFLDDLYITRRISALSALVVEGAW
jgi:hypothetical protein